MVRPILVLTCAVLGVLATGSGPVAANQGAASEPATLPIDVWVRDLQGQPVSSLDAGDFVVQVEGQQRRVRTARFIDLRAAEASSAPTADAASSAPQPVRTIAIVIDDLSFAGDAVAPLGDAAARWAASLLPSDRLAVVRSSLPTERVAATTAAEAGRVVRSAIGRPAVAAVSDFDVQRRTLEQVDAIARAISWLAAQPGPRVLVVVSMGVATPPAATRYLSTSVRVARDAGISTFLVTPAAGPSARAGWDSVPADGPRPAGAGLDQMALGLAARVLRAPGAADATFAEIQRAVSGFYRLDVDVPSSGTLLRAVPVTVAVRPAGLAVRTGALAMPSPGMSTPRTTADRTRDILAGVDVAADIDVDATTSLARDGASPDQLQLTVSLVVPSDVPSPVRVSFGLLDETGTLRSGTIDVPEATDGPRRTSAAIAVASGWHRLTLVAEDGQARLGSITRAIHARLREAGDFALAEPRVLWRADSDIWQMLGGDTLPGDARVAAAVFEVYPGTADREPPPLTLRLEDEGGREVATQTLTPVRMGQGWRLSSEVRLEGLAPGAYVFRLDTTPLGDRAAAVALRVRKVTPASAAVVAPRPAAPPLPAAADVISLFRSGVRDNWPRFVREDLLVPDLLRPQLKALAGARALPAALATATGDEWWAALRVASAQPTALGRAARGLVAIHDGDTRAGETRLRDAAADNPTSNALRRLLGVAYAASGRDDAAAGVWSLAMNARTDDPRWTLAFVEALGRVGDYRAALDLLRQMPGEPTGRRLQRTIDVFTVMGMMDEATTALEAWAAGEGRGEPAGRLMFYLVALRFAAALQPSAGAATIDDFRRLADRYVSAGGEYANVVTPWIESAAALTAR